MMPKLTWLVVAVTLLSACQQAPVRDEESQYSRVVPGSRITLQQELTVPAGHARVFLQYGKVIDKQQLDQYYPHCEFEIRQVSDGTLKIEPETFIVTKISSGEAMVVRRNSPYMHTAFGINSDQTNSMISPYVDHRLFSESQPNVMRMTCHGGFDDPWKARYPSVSDIRKALGTVAKVVLATSG